MFKMRNELLNTEKLEASEIKSAAIIKQYISKIYLGLIKTPLKVCKTMGDIYMCIKRNGRKSHRKGKKSFFDILGVSYHYQEKECKFVA